MKLSDLVRDPGTEQFSGSKLWKHIWNVLAAWSFIYLVLHGRITDAWSVAVFLAVSGGSEVASKLISMRYGAGVSLSSTAGAASPGDKTGGTP